MLNPERVILMSRLAMFEQRESRRGNASCSFFRSDYVGFKVLTSILSATVEYLIFVAAWILYHLGDLLQNIYVMDILEQGRQFLSWYILFAGAYALIALIVYTVRYNRMRRRMRAYLNGMRRLSRMMQEGKSG